MQSTLIYIYIGAYASGSRTPATRQGVLLMQRTIAEMGRHEGGDRGHGGQTIDAMGTSGHAVKETQ